MTLHDKQELVRLLNIYQFELVEKDQENRDYRFKHKDDRYYSGTLYSGVKAQYEHARCISRRLGVEINRELSTL